MLLQYLHKNRKVILLSVFCAVIFGVIFYLYSIPVSIVWYASLLCFFALMLVIVPDYFKFRKKRKMLEELQESIHLTIERLPDTADNIEVAYQKLLKLLYQSKADTENQAALKYSEMMDYYTLWAHQIKTPIAAMRLLLQAEENEQNAELLEQLFKTEQYVDMVLQYLRIGSMSSDFLIKQYSLDDMVRQSIRKYAKSFIRKKIQLDFSELNCTVVTDEKWLVFVIEQLLSNALKYTKQGKISIYMAPDREKTLVIEDTGIGIQAEDLPRILEKGYTGYNGRRDKKSTGIGLYLCKTITNKLNHGLYITSESEKGTKVWIDLASAELQVD